MNGDGVVDIETRRFVMLSTCRDCGHELNRTHEMTAEQLYESWTKIVMSQPLVTGNCPGGCRSTFSDCNLNCESPVVDVENKQRVDALAVYKITHGYYYADEASPCRCEEDRPIYFNGKDKRWPAACGLCGGIVQRKSSR